jgi:L-seryl-tRNA(Ser) seleniumtransferase
MKPSASMRHTASPLPSLDALLRTPEAELLIARFGRTATTAALRDELAARRAARAFGAPPAAIVDAAGDALARRFATTQRPVYNLTGTVLHTNLGRAPLPRQAVDAAADALASATTLEFDLATGRRGERDEPVARLLRDITGAEAATAVNNNAAAVLLILNTLALGKEVPVSRGELIEIGGSFRLPDIMSRAGVVLREVGTTNRTHARDFLAAIGPETALLMRVHQANYAIAGFTAAVARAELATIAHAAGLPLVEDLGSGSLIDLTHWGLPHEPTPREALAAGADLVCFSGDKLLGGPQAGLVVGRRELIRRLNSNPLKRALRLDKGRLAALEQVLLLYLNPDQLGERLPTLRLLTRPAAEVRAIAATLAESLQELCPGRPVTLEPCRSQIGSGALPVDLLESYAVTIGGKGLEALSAQLRALPRPVIGRLAEGRLWLDCRCLELCEVAGFLEQLQTWADAR